MLSGGLVCLVAVFTFSGAREVDIKRKNNYIERNLNLIYMRLLVENLYTKWFRKVYLGFCQTFMMELLAILVVNCIRIKIQHRCLTGS